MGFHGVALVKTFLLLYQLQCRTDINEAKVISALRQKSNLEFRTLKKNRIFGFPWFSTREDFAIDVSISM